MDIYRVTLKSTGSLQPCGTFWNEQVLYCGDSRDEARVTYHTYTSHASQYYNYGNPYKTIEVSVIKDGETDDFSDDLVEEMEF